MTETTLDQFVDNGVLPSHASKIKLRKKNVLPKEKHLHLILKGDSIARLERLQSIVQPSTQTGAVTTALQLFEAFIDEHQSGSEFYIKRKGETVPTKYEIFD